MIHTDSAPQIYRGLRIKHWDKVALKLDRWRSAGEYYQNLLSRIYRFLIPPGQEILELGCGLGDLLSSLEPRLGIGVDFSFEMLKRARQCHPSLQFVLADAHNVFIDHKFDTIILSDLVNDLFDVQNVFENLHRFSKPRTRIILNTYSLVWEPALKLAQRFGLGKPNLEQNWLTVEDIANLFHLTGFEMVSHNVQILLPVPVPLLAPLANNFLVKLCPFSYLALTNFIIARPAPRPISPPSPPIVSVIVPARNEAGNIHNIMARTPQMGSSTEIVFVEGHSSDNTFEAINTAITRFPEYRCQLIKQTGKGKGDAVRLGFEQARGDILMILDADLTVPPEDLLRFYRALVEGKGEFVNGVRLVYPVEEQAMRFLNFLGNKFFSLAFSWLLGQPIKDTLCGTKALWREDYRLISANRAYFGDFDPFGDFDLLFGAARLQLKIVDLPVRYRSRTYGKTNIDRWRHGWLLLKMVVFAARRLKFI